MKTSMSQPATQTPHTYYRTEAMVESCTMNSAHK
jgi:hypothetical protein